MKPSQFSDEEIVQKLNQHSDPQLFAELFLRHKDHVVRQCQKQVEDLETAKDLSQEVWIRVLTKLNQYRAESSFAAWLSIIVRNRCLDHFRQDKRSLHQDISQKIVSTLEEVVDTENVSKPTVDILVDLLDQISGEEKMLLLLKYQKGWSIRSIQQSLQLSESTVKVRLFRAREKMQRMLDENRDQD